MLEKPTRPDKLEGKRYAISYIRFSTKRQELGDSYERQLEATNKYCRDYDLILSEDNYNDLGASAYKSINMLPESGLGFFLHQLEQGEIKNPEKTCLIIESLDRLSRAKLDESMPVFMNILKKGIAIVTLSDNQIYVGDADNNSQTNQLMISLMMLSKAHAESLDKSYRIGKAWQKKKREARKNAKEQSGDNPVKALTKMCPFWLTINDSNEYEKKVDYVEIIKRIFDLTTGDYTRESEPDIFGKKEDEHNKKEGLKNNKIIEVDYLSLSSIEIVKLFNAESVPVLKSGNRKKTDYWNTSNINKILTNKALTGVYQPKKLVQVEKERIHPLTGKTINVKSQVYEKDGKPIKSFYPTVIETNQFLRANLYKRSRLKGKRGRKGNKFANILTNLATCRNCGSNMVHNFKGTSKKGKKWVYLQCSLAKSGGDCQYASVNYETVEYNLLRFMSSSEFSPVIGDKKSDQKRIDKLNKYIKEIDSRLENIKELYKAYVKNTVKGMEDFAEEAMNELSSERGILDEQRLEYSDELEFLIRNQLAEKFDINHFKRLVENIDVNNIKLSDEQIYFNRLRVNGIIENLSQAVKVDTIRKKLLVIYKDGSGQVISLQDKFIESETVPLCVNVPRFVFPDSIQGVKQGKFNDAVYNVCMMVLDRYQEFKANNQLTRQLKQKIAESVRVGVIDYLTEMAELSNCTFSFDKTSYTFFIREKCDYKK